MLFLILLMVINALPLDWITRVMCYFQDLGSLASKKQYRSLAVLCTLQCSPFQVVTGKIYRL